MMEHHNQITSISRGLVMKSPGFGGIWLLLPPATLMAGGKPLLLSGISFLSYTTRGVDQMIPVTFPELAFKCCVILCLSVFPKEASSMWGGLSGIKGQAQNHLSCLYHSYSIP